jgi:hypothetical protein
MAQNFLTCDREQSLLMPPDLREWLGRSGGARDGAAARRLWEVSERLTGITYPW